MKCIIPLVFLFSVVVTTAQEKNIEITGINMENIRYPFPVSMLSLQVQGQTLTMAYMDLVPKENFNGKAVLLLHGKNFYAAYWEQTANDLAGAGFRVIMPDQIGFGKSSKPTAIQYSFQLLAQNTKALLDHLNIKKISVVGHSMGGMLAVRFALMYPEITEKLILENPIGLEDWKTVVPYQSVDEWYQTELQQDYDSMKAYQQSSYYGGKWKPEYEDWLLPVVGWTKNKEYAIIAKVSALTYDMIYTQPVVYEFENIKAPTLLIIGQRDRTALAKNKAPKSIRESLGNYPVLGKAAVKRIPHCELVEIDNVGHLPHIEAFNQFIEPLLKFLKQ